VPVGGTGFPWLEEFNVFLKHQLVGFVQGVSKLGQGKLFRPGGFRGVDLIMQDYEGTVTIRPPWGVSEYRARSRTLPSVGDLVLTGLPCGGSSSVAHRLREFLANFDERRVGKYMDDGERATWPQLPLIRSLCEVEFCLDEVAAGLGQSMAAARAARDMADAATSGAAGRRGSLDQMRGKLPSYVSLAAYGDDGDGDGARAGSGVAAYPVAEAKGQAKVRVGAKMPGVASHASLLNLASLDMLPDDDVPPSAGLAPFSS
jgi:hypothetical protein